MAKAQFHKNQRVYVKTVGTWSLIERVVPHWAKGLEEPLRIYYDVGLGREFGADELETESVHNSSAIADAHNAETWRLVRGRNKFKAPDECSSHPYPGTHPQIVTSDVEWGGWRVPGAEYDLYPAKIEYQARVIVTAPKMIGLLRALVDHAKLEPENTSHEVMQLCQEATRLLRYVDQDSQQ